MTKLIDAVGRSGQRNLKVRWRFFSLTQVNHRSEDPDDAWTVWTAPESESVRGRLAFKAAEAARRQGTFDAFHMALLDARHNDRADIESEAVIEGVARTAGLDLQRFQRDLADPEILAALSRDHREAREVHGVFGTPTLVFPSGAAYVRLAHVVPDPEAVRVFDHIAGTVEGEPAGLEIKPPVRPSACGRYPRVLGA